MVLLAGVIGSPGFAQDTTIVRARAVAANVLPPFVAPRAVASPPSTPRLLRMSGFARGVRLAPARRSLRSQPQTAAPAQLFFEAFNGPASSANAWSYGGGACLSAGSAAQTPSTSIPACGSNAPADVYPNGALQLTAPVNNSAGFVFNQKKFPTGNGLSITFEYYSFNGVGSPGDGVALVLTDASKAAPTGIGGCCGSLGYAPYAAAGRVTGALPNGYLGIGLDESGYYTAAVEGKTGGTPGLLPNAITVRGAAATNAPFLLSTENSAGQPGPLPFALYHATTYRPLPTIVTITLTAYGKLSVTIDRSDGNGPLSYIAPTELVAVKGQPALPANVYIGLSATTGGDDARHEINGLSISTAPTAPKTSVLTYHNDVNRTGWNPNETTLTTANVNASTFGLRHTVSVDARIDAQPLLVADQPVDGQDSHDTLYVVTENNTIYMIDAESGTILWARNLGTPVLPAEKDGDINVEPTYGILSTPVIDPANDAIYFVTDTNEGSGAPDVYRLHKLALNNLSDLAPSVVIAPPATLNDGTTAAFAAQHQLQRPGLLEANGNIYVAFGSTGDLSPYSRGVITAFNAATLAPAGGNFYTDRLDLTANPFYLSSIWQSGYGIAADASGYVYFSTANSDPYSASYAPPYNYPESVLKLSSTLGTVLDSFTLFNYFLLDEGDGDLGSGGTMVVPDQNGRYPHLLVAGGKDGQAYVLNRDNLGGFAPSYPNHDLLQLNSGACWCGPAYFVGADGTSRIVTGGANGVSTWRIGDGTSLTLTAEGNVGAANTNGQPDYGGTIPVVSSNGTAAGSAIVWFVQRPNDTTTYTLNLQAYDASNLSHQLYKSNAGSWPDQYSNANVVPTVANGHVYVASYGQVQIYGLLGQ
jgi:hypothetical protein